MSHYPDHGSNIHCPGRSYHTYSAPSNNTNATSPLLKSIQHKRAPYPQVSAVHIRNNSI